MNYFIIKEPTGHLVCLTSLLTIEGWQDKNYTGFSITNGDDKVLGRGAAHRDPDDKFDADIGQQLALGRALESASRKILNRANGMVKHREDCKEQREIGFWTEGTARGISTEAPRVDVSYPQARRTKITHKYA